MTYLHFFIKSNQIFLIVMSLLFMIPGIIDLYYGEEKLSLSLSITGALTALLMTYLLTLKMFKINLLVAIVMMILISILFFLLNHFNYFINLFTGSTTIGFIVFFIMTAGAVGSPEAAIPSALIGGLATGFVAVTTAHRAPDIYTTLKGACTVSFISVALTSNIVLYAIMTTVLTMLGLFNQKKKSRS